MPGAPTAAPPATPADPTPPRARDRRGRALDRVAVLVATAGGVGFAPVAPGTVASALTAAVLALASFSPAAGLIFLAIVTAAGTWAAHRAEPLLGGKDPGAIVIDEVAGMTLAVLGPPPTLPALLAGFVLFRVLDVLKPFPAGACERWRGGFGVMADDLVAGLYALAGVTGLRLAGWL